MVVGGNSQPTVQRLKFMKIGVDLGGTNLRVGLVDEEQLLKILTRRCPADQPERVVVDAICDLIAQLWNPMVTGIGVGVPSLVDSVQGIVYNVVNIPSMKKVYLKDILSTRFATRVAINNDANCFALGVHKYGEGKPYKHLVGITVGTGLGAGLIINGKLYSGHNTGAGEVGCLPYNGHNFEYYCSSAFFLRNYGSDAANLATTLIDEVAVINAWKEFGCHLGHLVCSVIDAYDPEAVVFGGGIAQNYSMFYPAMLREIYKFPFPETVRRLHVLHETKEDVALLGAAQFVDE